MSEKRLDTKNRWRNVVVQIKRDWFETALKNYERGET